MVQETEESHSDNRCGFIATFSCHLLQDFLSSLWREIEYKICSLSLFWKLTYIWRSCWILFLLKFYIFPDFLILFKSKFPGVKFVKSMLQFHDQKVTFSNIFTLQNNVFFLFISLCKSISCRYCWVYSHYSLYYQWHCFKFFKCLLPFPLWRSALQSNCSHF